MPAPPTPPAVAWYQRLVPRGNVACVMLAFLVLVSIAAIVSDIFEIRLANDLMSGDEFDPSRADASDTRQAIVALVRTGAWLACAVTFIAWMNTAYRNVPAIWRHRPHHSQGWAIGAWFVPFLNLWRPYAMMREIWRSGDPDADPSDAHEETRPVSALLPAWWWLFIISGIVTRIAASNTRAGDGLDAIADGDRIHIFGLVIAIIAAILAIVVIRESTDRMEHNAATARHAAGMPPPL